MMATVLICGWVVLAKILQSIPSKDNHWRRTYVLIAVGIAVLRWPLYRSVGWLKEKEL